MERNLTFRNAERNDTALILKFINLDFLQENKR